MENEIVWLKRPESNWYTKTLVDYLCLNYNEWLAFLLMFDGVKLVFDEERLIACLKNKLVYYFVTRGVQSGYFTVDEVDAVDWDAIATYLLKVNRPFWEWGVGSRE